jgi:hypothetical protein
VNHEIQISFNKNAIIVTTGDSSKTFANLIASEKSTNKIVAIGQTEHEIASYDPEQWKQKKQNIIFEPIFDPQQFDPENLYWAVRTLIGVGIFDKITCYANIPDYESFQADARKHFETSLQDWRNLKALSVNGTMLISKGWEFSFAELTLEWGWRILIVLVVILLAKNPELLFDFFRSLVKKSTFSIGLVYTVLILTIMWITEITWMFVMQAVLPKKTLRRIYDSYQLQFTRPDKNSVSKVFANLILGKDR